MKRLLFLIVIGMALTAQAQRQKTATPPLVYNVENTMAKAAKPKMLPANELPVIRELPDALQGVTTFKDWAARRHAVGHSSSTMALVRNPPSAPTTCWHGWMATHLWSMSP